MIKTDWIGRVTGRVVEDMATPAPTGAVPTDPRQSRADYDEELGNSTPVGQIPSETVVNELLAAWNDGQQNEVAAQLLFTPVSYADFVKLCFAMGQDGAIQLGLMLDDLAESEGMVADEPSENRILNQRPPPPPRRLAGGPSEVPAAGGEQQVPASTAQAADAALPPPPNEEPEPIQPQERNE